MRALLGYIRRFGFWRGLEFKRVAGRCDKNPRLLDTWATYYRARASREFAHDNIPDGRAFMAFAELLSSAHSTMVLKRRPRQPILSRQQRRIERTIQRGLAKKRRLI